MAGGVLPRRRSDRDRVKFFRSGESDSRDLPRAEVTRALHDALDECGFWLVVDDTRGNARVGGRPGSLRAELLTDVWVSEGLVETECRLPIIVDHEDRMAALELALWLTISDGRMSYCIDTGGTPFLRCCTRLSAALRGDARQVVRGALETMLTRAEVAEEMFRAVAQRNLADMGDELGEIAATRGHPWASDGSPWSDTQPGGATWEGLGHDLPAFPAGFPVPDGYTEQEYEATFAVLAVGAASDNRAKGGLVDACAGPLLIHADGVVECYGCSDPAENPHLNGITVACADGLRLGPGHCCERCKEHGA